MALKRISQLTAGTAALTSIIPASDAAGTATSKITVQSILNAESRWSLFLPPAPTSVTATAGNAQATVSWAAPTVLSVTPITDYVVQYSTNSGTAWTTVSDGTSTAATATVTGLANDSSHVFRVAAVNVIGTGAFSTASSAVTVGQPPDPFFSSVQLLLHMDGSGSTFIDSSSTPKTITASGATQSSAQSKWGGKSAYFDGTGSHFRFAGAFNPSGVTIDSGPFAIELWFKSSSTTQYAQLIGNERNGGSSGFSLLLNNNTPGQVAVFGSNGTLGFWSAAGGYNDNQWHHVALARNSSNMLSLYVDGVRVGQQQFSASLASENDYYVGTNSQFSARNYEGYIDDLRITVNSDRGYTGASITVPTAAFPDA